MDWSRRRTLRAASGSALGTVVAGCLSSGDDGTGEADENDDESDRNRDPGEPAGDAEDRSIDGRLHNDAATARVFAVTVRDETGTVVADDERDVPANGTTRIPAIAGPGESRTIEVTVDGTTATETLAFDVEPIPGGREGYVDVTYTAEEGLEIRFTPIENTGDDDLPRVDEPPYEIIDPGCGPDGGREPLWLCEAMPTAPSLSFEQVSTTGAVRRDEGLTGHHDDSGSQFYAALLTDTDGLERVRRREGSAVDELLAGTDPASEAVLVVQTGWGSGTVRPHLKRVETTRNGVHAFGCHRLPCERTDDITARTVLARFDRPASLESAHATLTVDADRRVTVAAGEGVVTVDE
ncbi:hypothetical protein C488_04667 [Natrinema pellirubrum DSM 15624]|uniref:Uncharacterized protein n=1 Tax=Natrinema pellirubrum (strain DSM 15624 / CIP 106293 / JCM 10476 / NCIMB 786 / 157) TaxID=797303 RepID=L0JFR8_NATP1|nr:hypothetical protein [Natrinema pellirubrum]AGB30360.1 hypothetical protein Natpe_0430 [Natrinema pellirubrum DSM 15624]ELY79413.1 hypothetical protein C488_04667 [Natrinema pellirubrum DSM 15624]